VALVAVAEGFLYAFDQMTAAGQVDLVAEEVNCSDISLSAIDERTAMRIRARPEVKSISRMILGVTSAPGLPFLMLYGLDPAEDYIRHYRIREGQLMRRGQEIILGRFAANSLKKGVGDKVRLGGTSYTIVGIYENGSAYEDAGGVMLLRDAQNFFNRPDQMTLLGIQLKPEYQPRAAEIARQLEAQFPEVIVSRSEDLTSRMQDMQTTYAFINALIALTLVVGGIVMMNAMLMSVFERTQEIGVLRALGWTTGRVMGMVVVEALALSLLSGLVGIGIGWGLNAVLLLEPTLGVYLQPAYSPALFVEVGLLAGGLGLVGGVYPAWRAARLRPIEALRYE
jgi:ABC-type antimicrobial peptide transport system permease subunit